MKNFAISILSSDEVYISGNRIYEIISTDITNDPFLTKILPILKPKLNDLSVSIGRTTDSGHVKLLEAKDTVRDLRYVGLRDYCKALSSDADSSVANAAALLEDVFRELGWSMQLEGYATESTLLDSLIGKFEKAPFSIALTTIGATTRFTGLKTAQADFESTYKEKVDANAKKEYPKMRSCRISIARYLNAMLPYIDVMTEIDGGAYKTTADKIDEVITEFGAMARNRITRKKAEDAKGAPTTTK
jgi:hypothetical protein